MEQLLRQPGQWAARHGGLVWAEVTRRGFESLLGHMLHEVGQGFFFFLLALCLNFLIAKVGITVRTPQEGKH